MLHNFCHKVAKPNTLKIKPRQKIAFCTLMTKKKFHDLANLHAAEDVLEDVVLVDGAVVVVERGRVGLQAGLLATGREERFSIFNPLTHSFLATGQLFALKLF